MVTKLLDVDRKARQLLDDTKAYYERTIEEIGKEKVQLRAQYEEKAATHLADVRRTESAQIEDATDRITARTTARIAALEENYGKNHSSWEDELFSRCINRISAEYGSSRDV